TGDEVLAEQEVAAKDVKANVVEEPSVPVSATSTKVSAATTTTTATIPTSRKGIIITELGTSTTTTTISSQLSQAKVQDKGKGILLQAKFDEEERLAREKDEANIALTEEWYDIQAKVEADYQLAQRLQAQEQEELTSEEKARLFIQFLEQRRKHFAAKRAEGKRNKPPTQAQQRKIMCTYLKNMVGKKPKDLKNKSFDSIQKMFDRAFKRVNTFVDFRIDLVEDEVDDDQETTKIKELMKIVSDEEEVAIDAIPLATKPPSIPHTGSVDVTNDTLRVPYAATPSLHHRVDEILLINAAGGVISYYCSKIKTAERVSTVRERIKTEERIKIVWRSRLLT
ncbi:hypothetical protein Tco_1382981, partial [Tanacetum coccineum]